jgi:hypothetical protein
MTSQDGARDHRLRLRRGTVSPEAARRALR